MAIATTTSYNVNNKRQRTCVSCVPEASAVNKRTTKRLQNHRAIEAPHFALEVSKCEEPSFQLREGCASLRGEHMYSAHKGFIVGILHARYPRADIPNERSARERAAPRALPSLPSLSPHELQYLG
eukprot:1191279-Prorocentrum_minimum.AAC.2